MLITNSLIFYFSKKKNSKQVQQVQLYHVSCVLCHVPLKTGTSVFHDVHVCGQASTCVHVFSKRNVCVRVCEALWRVA